MPWPRGARVWSASGDTRRGCHEVSRIDHWTMVLGRFETDAVAQSRPSRRAAFAENGPLDRLRRRRRAAKPRSEGLNPADDTPDEVVSPAGAVSSVGLVACGPSRSTRDDPAVETDSATPLLNRYAPLVRPVSASQQGGRRGAGALAACRGTWRKPSGRRGSLRSRRATRGYGPQHSAPVELSELD